MALISAMVERHRARLAGGEAEGQAEEEDG
jgi:hypothetical protein